MNYENLEIEETSDKSRIIIRQTENIETVMSLIKVEPQLPVNNQPFCSLEEVSPLQSGTLIILWFFVLLAQVLMLWRVKKTS